jgi:hypothetical protein
MIVEDQDMSAHFFALGDRSRHNHEDCLLSQRRGTRHPVSSNDHHSFLKRSKADISRNVKFFRHFLSVVPAIRAMTNCYRSAIHAQRYAAIRQITGLSMMNPTAMLVTNGAVNCFSVEAGTRSEWDFHCPESRCRASLGLDREIRRNHSQSVLSGVRLVMSIISSIRRRPFQKELKFPGCDLAKTDSSARSCQA